MNSYGRSKMNRSTKVLHIDDSQTELKYTSTVLCESGFEVYSASNFREARTLLKVWMPDIILLDLEMPEVSGFEVLKYLKSNIDYQKIPVIMLSGTIEEEVIEHAFEAGVVDFIRKPYYKRELVLRITLHLENIRFKKENEIKAKSMREEIVSKVLEVRNLQDTTIFALAKLAESRDPETGNHLERIREYTLILARELSRKEDFRNQVNDKFVENIYHMSALHDIGKVGIPDYILLKPGKLNSEEYEIMKRHTLIGGKALEESSHHQKEASFLEMGKEIAYHHHERWDGKGYPFGLKKSHIPLSARIVILADVYDAVSFKRVYRKEAMTEQEIEKIMEDGNGSLFDPDIWKVYEENKTEFKKIKEKMME